MSKDNQGRKKDDDIKWHHAFYAALQLEFYEDKDKLEFMNEYYLSKEPLRIDVKIIKKISTEKLSNEIGNIFKKYNIIEYKSPDDYTSIDDFYKVYAYGCLYKSLSNKINEIDINEITLTFCCKSKPIKLIKYLQQTHNYKIIEKFEGIYYIIGGYFPIQMVLNTNLNKKQHLFLKGLDNKLDDLELATSLVKTTNSLKDSNTDISALLTVIFKANPELFKEVFRMSNTAELEKVVTEIIYEQGWDKVFIQKGKEEGIREGKEEGIKEGKEEGIREGKAKGEYDKAIKVARKLLSRNFSVEQVAEDTELPIEEVLELQNQLKNLS